MIQFGREYCTARDPACVDDPEACPLAGLCDQVTNQEGDGDWEGVPEVQDERFVHQHTFETEGAYEFASKSAQGQGMVGVVVGGDPDPP